VRRPPPHRGTDVVAGTQGAGKAPAPAKLKGVPDALTAPEEAVARCRGAHHIWQRRMHILFRQERRRRGGKGIKRQALGRAEPSIPLPARGGRPRRSQALRPFHKRRQFEAFISGRDLTVPDQRASTAAPCATRRRAAISRGVVPSMRRNVRDRWAASEKPARTAASVTLAPCASSLHACCTRNHRI
jgi:hypothetical protein